MNKKSLLGYDIDSEEIRILLGERFMLIRKVIFRKNQTQVAKLLGISLDRISDFERGKKISDPSIVYKLLLYIMSRGIDIRLLFLEDFDVYNIRYKKPNFKFNMSVI